MEIMFGVPPLGGVKWRPGYLFRLKAVLQTRIGMGGGDREDEISLSKRLGSPGHSLIQRRFLNLFFLCCTKLAQFRFQFRTAVGENRDRQERGIGGARFTNR
jgi:hypothetical protein